MIPRMHNKVHQDREVQIMHEYSAAQTILDDGTKQAPAGAPSALASALALLATRSDSRDHDTLRIKLS